ncbi:hypothetical protein, partial [Bilophila sp.]|uniref:hypothetical protein n=1 Tax=Bilophila sp. TaxID=1929485 RepID=UPI003077C4E3
MNIPYCYTVPLKRHDRDGPFFFYFPFQKIKHQHVTQEQPSLSKTARFKKSRPKHFGRLSYTGNTANKDSINTKALEEGRKNKIPTSYAGTAFPLKNSPLLKKPPKTFGRLSYTGNIANKNSISTKALEEGRKNKMPTCSLEQPPLSKTARFSKSRPKLSDG